MLRCPECGTPYKQITGGNKQYCSERCRKRAERKRWRAKRKEFEQMSPEEQKQIKDKKEKALFEKSQREEARKAKLKAAFEKKREDPIFCSPTCNRSYHWKHGKKRKYQAKAQQIAQLVRRKLPGSKWERVLDPNNSVDRIFIYGY